LALKDEIKSYVQPDGLISPDSPATPDSTGNGLLYLSLYHILLVRSGLSRPDDFAAFNSVVSACVVRRSAAGQTSFFKGLFTRSPTKVYEMESLDDYIGICAASRVLASDQAADVVMRGISHRFFCFRWIYNCLSPGKFTAQSWFGRMGGVIAHFLWSADLKPNLFRRIWWAVSVVSAGAFTPRDSTSVILTSLMVDTMAGKSLLCTLAGAFWSWRVCVAWGTNHLVNGDSAAMALALADHLGRGHPIAKYWR
jgi:hypothetical protein